MEKERKEKFIHEISDILNQRGISLGGPIRVLIEVASEKMGERYKTPYQIAQDIQELRYNSLL